MAKLRRKRKRDKVREAAYGRHSPAGYRYLQSPQVKKDKKLYRTSPKRKKIKEIERTALSRQTKKQLQGLHGTDYAEVMKMLRRKR